MSSILLVGFMGAGKSTVGRLLARRLGRCFVETDEMIVARAGRSIPEIFRDFGEAHFRSLEAETVELLKEKRGNVVATGGGLPCQEGRMDVLREIGTVVWLKGEFREMYERASRRGQRPLLADRTPAELQALYEDRERHYRRAHLTIETTGLGVDRVVWRILGDIRQRHGARIR